MPNLLPGLLPWLAVLALLALPSNRIARAWWIWAPLGVLALLGAGLGVAADSVNNEGLSYWTQAVGASAFGLAVVWLLGAVLARRCRALSLVLMPLAFAAVSLLTFVLGPAGEQLSDLSRMGPAVLLYLVLFWAAAGLVFTGALNLTGWCCRRRFSRVRIRLWLLLWLWAMWIVAGGVLGCVVAFTSGGGFEWIGLLVTSFILALVSFAVVLPYLILSFTNSLYRERLEHFLRLPATGTVPAAPAVVLVAEQAVRQ